MSNDYWDTIAVFAAHWLGERHYRYHRRSDTIVDGIFKTKCGIVLSRYNPDGERLFKREVAMRREHAEKFATPCRKCWGIPAWQSDDVAE